MNGKKYHYDGFAASLGMERRFENPICVSKSLLKHSSFHFGCYWNTTSIDFIANKAI